VIRSRERYGDFVPRTYIQRCGRRVGVTAACSSKYLRGIIPRDYSEGFATRRKELSQACVLCPQRKIAAKWTQGTHRTLEKGPRAKDVEQEFFKGVRGRNRISHAQAAEEDLVLKRGRFLDSYADLLSKVKQEQDRKFGVIVRLERIAPIQVQKSEN